MTRWPIAVCAVLGCTSPVAPPAPEPLAPSVGEEGPRERPRPMRRWEAEGWSLTSVSQRDYGGQQAAYDAGRFALMTRDGLVLIGPARPPESIAGVPLGPSLGRVQVRYARAASREVLAVVEPEEERVLVFERGARGWQATPVPSSERARSLRLNAERGVFVLARFGRQVRPLALDAAEPSGATFEACALSDIVRDAEGRAWVALVAPDGAVALRTLDGVTTLALQVTSECPADVDADLELGLALASSGFVLVVPTVDEEGRRVTLVRGPLDGSVPPSVQSVLRLERDQRVLGASLDRGPRGTVVGAFALEGPPAIHAIELAVGGALRTEDITASARFDAVSTPRVLVHGQVEIAFRGLAPDLDGTHWVVRRTR